MTDLRTWIDTVEGTMLAESVIDFDPHKTRFLFDLDLAASRGELRRSQMTALRRLLSNHEFIRLYHGTSVRHDVWNKGLLPTSAARSRSIQSGNGYVYLSYDPGRALSFARMAYPGDPPYVVYAVIIPIRNMRADTDQLWNKRMWGDNPSIGNSRLDSLVYGGGVKIKGKVETYRIKVYGYFDNSGNPMSKPDSHFWGDDSYR